ncbi:MAG TPA: DUF4349 domain-containing protein [Candidatus Bathyarchaeia archaeon]|nr:DUF4349 domain-containing protein [Candidatus Bathyarchaeia archaeon]
MSASDVIGTERLEALLRGDAPRTQEESARGALLSELRAAMLHAPETLRERVLATAPAPRRLSLRLPSRRLALVAVPAALGLAVAAALVHGLTGPGGQTVQDRVAAAPAVVGAKAQPSTVFRAATGSGAAVPSAPSSLQAQVAPPVGSGGRLQHTEASLQVRVPDVGRLSAATSAATRIATSLGGYAQSVVYRTPQSGGGASYIELRVPAQNVRAALAKLAALGSLVSQQVSVQDLQHDFAVESAQIAQLRRTVAALQKALHNPALPEAQRVLLQIKLAESKRALAQRLHARTGTVASGTTARISLVLSTEKSIVPVVHHRGRLGRMLHSAVGFLGLEGTIVLYALIVAGPLALAVALVWGLARLRRRRDERRLLTA